MNPLLAIRAKTPSEHLAMSTNGIYAVSTSSVGVAIVRIYIKAEHTQCAPREQLAECVSVPQMEIHLLLFALLNFLRN